MNWLQNGQPVGAQDRTTTEDGAYTFNGYADVGVRNQNATIVLPTEDEWYKAAYYDGSASRYFGFPTRSDVLTRCRAPTSQRNSASCNDGSSTYTPSNPENVGSYTGSASSYGTFDQGGNIQEWTETIVADGNRVMRGGSFLFSPTQLGADVRIPLDPTFCDYGYFGFRVATLVLEPSTGLLVASGVIGLAIHRPTKAQLA